MRSWRWLLALTACGCIVRTLLLGAYEPLAQPDTGTYIAAARDLLAGDLSVSVGRRTPGYPLLIAVAGERPERIVAAQMVAGLLTSLLLFQITLAMTKRPGVAFAVGLAHDLNLQQLYLEGALLTETLSTLSVAAVAWALILSVRRLRAGRRAGAWLLATGSLAATAILIRPQFLYLLLLVPAVVVYAGIAGRQRPFLTLGRAGLAALPALACVVAWSGWVHAKTGYFVMSTQSGFGLVNHSIAFIELAPERYANVREILLKYRERQKAEIGTYGNTIWYAWPEIREATGWSLPEASRQMQRMSAEMFARHPVRYAVSVGQAWYGFWAVPAFWETSHIRPTWLVTPLDKFWSFQQKGLRLANLAFVVLVFLAAVWPRFCRATRWDLELSIVSTIVLMSSLLQALADQGASSRYLATTQSLVVLAVVVIGVRLAEQRRRASSSTAADQGSIPAPAEAAGRLVK